MKLADLKTGEHYFYQNSKWSWENGLVGTEVVLVSTDRYGKGSGWNYYPSRTGSYVEVRTVGGEGRTFFAHQSHLRGTWAEASAVQQERRVARKRRETEQNEHRQQRAEQADRVQALAKQAGVAVRWRPEGEFVLTGDALEMLLQRVLAAEASN